MCETWGVYIRLVGLLKRSEHESINGSSADLRMDYGWLYVCEAKEHKLWPNGSMLPNNNFAVTS